MTGPQAGQYISMAEDGQTELNSEDLRIASGT